MSPAPTKPWQARLEEMNHSKGTTNKMIQKAMLAEIMALRKLLRPDMVEWRKAKAEQIRGGKTEQRLQAELIEAMAKLCSERSRVRLARASRDEWRAQALKYQKQLIEKSLRP